MWLSQELRQRAQRLVAQVRSAWLLRIATERMEEEDFEGALEQFQQAIAVDAPTEIRLLAYHGTVIALLRLGKYQESLVVSEDARTLLRVWPPEAESEEVTAAREALQQARDFAQWALDHPLQAAAVRDREMEGRMEGPSGSPAPLPLGRAEAWPVPLRTLYRLAVHSVVTAGLMLQAAERGELARKLLRAAGEAARFDRRLERDVYWHLSRLDDTLGHEKEARDSRQRYERLQQEVRQVLRRLRWTN
jgi:tetratricopeptide (TPR) repeat protein